MKKLSKILLGLVVLSVLGYSGYKHLKKKPSLLGKIHIDADSAIKVGVQEIKETLFLDALTSPGYYFERSDFSSLGDGDGPNKGINLLPYNLIFYTLPDVKNTLFSTFSIKDSNAFEAYIAKEIEKKSATIEYAPGERYRFVTIEKSKIALAWDPEKLVIALSPELKPDAFHKVFKDVLVEGKTISDDNNELIRTLTDYDDHMVYIKNNSSATINFKDGKAVIAGNLKTTTPQQFMPEITTETTPNTSFQCYFDANFENNTNKNEFIAALSDASFFKKNGLDVTKIADRTNGYFSLAIAGRTAQSDTIITYTYDDNFEKIEKRTLQVAQVPKMHINLGAENQSLKDYLLAQKTIDENEVFEPFPLYKMYVKDGPMNTAFDTFEGRMITQKQISSSFFRCQIDFKKLKEDLDIPLLRKHFKNLVKMQLYASQKEGNRVVLKGGLTAADPNINIIAQLLPEKQSDSVQ